MITFVADVNLNINVDVIELLQYVGSIDWGQHHLIIPIAVDAHQAFTSVTSTATSSLG